jgi:hypothetical protein
MAMAKAGSRRRKTWMPDKEGRYSRQLGWKRNEQGTLVQHKFYLGTDERQAERRNHKLEELWERIEELWGQVVHLPGNDQPTWDNMTLEIGRVPSHPTKPVESQSWCSRKSRSLWRSNSAKGWGNDSFRPGECPNWRSNNPPVWG